MTMTNIEYWYSLGDDLSFAKGLQTACALATLTFDPDISFTEYSRLRLIVEACDAVTFGKGVYR